MSRVELEATDGERLPLEEVTESWRDGLPHDLRPPAIDELELVTRPVDEQEAIDLIGVLTGYPAFSPPVPAEDRDRALLELIVASDSDQVPFEAALAVEGLGPDAVASLVRRVAGPGAHLDRLDRIETLFDYLLDDMPSRPTVVDAIRRWPTTPELAELRSRVAVYLTDDERRLSGIDGRRDDGGYPEPR